MILAPAQLGLFDVPVPAPVRPVRRDQPSTPAAAPSVAWREQLYPPPRADDIFTLDTIRPFQFLLGLHKPKWLGDERLADIPVLVSRRTLAKRRRLPRAVGPYALDSGGFTELQIAGRWTLSPQQYVDEVRRIIDALGRDKLLWVAPMDWMCEPLVRNGGVVKPRRGKPIVFKGTGLPVLVHQMRTVQNFLELRRLAPDVPWMPVLQGWEMEDYFFCALLYARAGVDLFAERVVGVGSVCRRQSTIEVARLLEELYYMGLRLHAFGLKMDGIKHAVGSLVSSDSLAWSLHAVHRPPIEGHDMPGPGRPKGHKSCANCLDYALQWRAAFLYDVFTALHRLAVSDPWPAEEAL
jgi:hypothetical protein